MQRFSSSLDRTRRCACNIARRPASGRFYLIILSVLALGVQDAAVMGQEIPYSVQMHVHGSFSEGAGSMSAQSLEAVNASVDVIWWSDHDWRMTYHRHVSTFSFEAVSEPIGFGETWTPSRNRELSAQKGLVLYRGLAFEVRSGGISSEQAYTGTSSLKLEGSSSQGSFQSLLVRFGSDRARHKRSLASDVHLQLAVYPDLVGADARIGVQLVLSDHPANSEVPVQASYILHYYLSNAGGLPFRSDNVYNIPIPYTEAEWNILDLPVSQDALTGFPFIDGRDHSLFLIAFGIESRNGQLGRAFFDDLRISETLSGNALLAVQGQMADDLEVLVPSVVQHVGTEISYEIEHLNEFSAATQLHDWDDLAATSSLIDPITGWITNLQAFRQFAAAWVVDRAHDAGGVVSLNHTYGPDGDPYAGTREDKVLELLSTRAFGVDILEVGYRERAARTLDDYLWTWDELAKEGLLLVGNGVSDTHGGPAGHWLSFDNNFVSWIYASSAAIPDLIDGLKGGRVYFGDIGLYDGALDIESDRDFRMGQVVVTDRSDVELTFTADGLAAGDEVRLVEYGQPFGSTRVQTSTFAWTGSFAIHNSLGSFYRFEVYDPFERAKVFSNPIYFVRQVPEDGLRSERAAIDLGDIYSVSFQEFFLTAATLTDQGTSQELTLSGSATNPGEIRLDATAAGAPSTVTFNGLSGTWSFDGSILTLTGLLGTGSIEVVFPTP